MKLTREVDEIRKTADRDREKHRSDVRKMVSDMEAFRVDMQIEQRQLKNGINNLQQNITQGRKEDSATLTQTMKDIGKSISASINEKMTSHLTGINHVLNITCGQVKLVTEIIDLIETEYNKAVR